MLNTIDTVIAFAVIMTVLSLLITTIVQMISAAFSLRGKNLANALALTFQTIDPKIGEHAHSLANQVLRDPIFSDSLWRGKTRPPIDPAAQPLIDAERKLKEAKARKADDFMRDQAIADAQVAVEEAKKTAPTRTVEPNRKAAWGFWSPPWGGGSALGSAIRPGEIYRMLQEIGALTETEAAWRDIPPQLVKTAGDLLAALQPLDQPAIESQRKLAVISKVAQLFQTPGEQQTILAALDNLGATVERATTQAYDRFQRWFGSAQDRAEQWFQMHVRIVTIVFSILIAFLLQLDTVEMFRSLRVHPHLVDALTQSASGVMEVGRDVLNPANTAAHESYLLWLGKHQDLALEKLPVSGSSGAYHEAIEARLDEAKTKGTINSADASAYLADYDALTNEGTKEFLQKKQETVQSLKQALAGTEFDFVPTSFLGRWDTANKPSGFLTRLAQFWPHLFGVFVTAALLTLGAPFWFNLLKNLTSLRPAVASLIEKRPASAPALPPAPEQTSSTS